MSTPMRVRRVVAGAGLCAAAATTMAASAAPPVRDRITAVSCNPGPAAPQPRPAIAWRGNGPRWGEWRVTLGHGRGVDARIVVVTLDPGRIALSLELLQEDGAIRPWTIESAPRDALVAMNAGQFTDDGPWGWVVHRGREWQSPGVGDLAGAFVVDTAGHAFVVRAGDIAAKRASRTVREAVQSYPMLLEGDGRVPSGLCERSPTIDREHRDTRLAIGVDRDGRVVIAMSRYDGTALPDRIPIGPTTPEMAEIMRRLGATSALMLDGGLSAQLLVRERSGGNAARWPGLRNVPLALVGRE